MLPGKLSPKILLMRLYRQMGEREKVVGMAKWIAGISVKHPTDKVARIKQEAERVLQEEYASK